MNGQRAAEHRKRRTGYRYQKRRNLVRLPHKLDAILVTKYLPSYYEHLERQLREVFDQLTEQLSEKERRWISEWIDVGEYGLAVNALLEHLREKRSITPPAVIQRVRDIATAIGLADEVEKELPGD